MIPRRRLSFIGALSLAAVLATGCAQTSTGGSTPTATSGPTGSLTPTATSTGTTLVWSSVAVAVAASHSSALTIENINPFNGNQQIIATVQSGGGTQLDSVSPDGRSIAYHTSDGSGGATYTVATLDGSGTQIVGHISGPIGNAVWQHDNAHLAVASSGGYDVMATAGGSVQTVTGIASAGLVGYLPDDSKLLFIGAGSATGVVPGALYAATTGNPATVVQLTPRQVIPEYLISPNGQSAFYANSGPSGLEGIYQASINGGTQPTVLRSIQGVPIGFAADGSLLVAQAQGGKVQLLKLGATASADTVLTANILTGGGTVPALSADVVVAPDGSGVVALVQLSSGGFALDFTDLTVPTPQAIRALNLASDTRVNLAGWDTDALPSSS